MSLEVWLASGQGRNDLGIVIWHLVNDRAVGFELVRPRALIFELAVESFPALGLLFGVDQRKFGTLINRNISAISNLEQAQDVLRLFFDPLISADRRDTENVKLLRLEKNQDGLLIAGTRTTGVLIDNDLDPLGLGNDGTDQNQETEQAGADFRDFHG